VSLRINVEVTKKVSKLDSILKRLEAVGNKETRVGFFNDDYYEDGNYVAQVAKWNDQGVPVSQVNRSIPPRPFMSSGLRDILKSRPYLKMYAQFLSKALAGKIPASTMYEKIGQYASDDLKEVIDRWTTPPNAWLTVQIKGFNDPLVHTGKMRDSAKFKVANSRKKQRKLTMRSRSTIRVR
jgi:hypothetical protein